MDYQDYHQGDYEYDVQSPPTLSKVLNGRATISPAMALRIERWLGRDHGGAAEVWLAQQAAYDLWQARAAVKASKALSGVKTLKFHSA